MNRNGKYDHLHFTMNSIEPFALQIRQFLTRWVIQARVSLLLKFIMLVLYWNVMRVINLIWSIYTSYITDMFT